MRGVFMRSLHPAETARVKGGTAIVPVAVVAPACMKDPRRAEYIRRCLLGGSRVHEGSSLAPIMVPATIGHVTVTFPERFP